MSNEINDRIKEDIEDKISSMTTEEKLKYMFDFVLNNPTIYDEKDIDNILFLKYIITSIFTCF